MKEIKLPGKSYQILVKKSTRAKRVRISINRQSQISLIIPKYQSYSSAQKFLLSKTDWIEKNLTKIQSRQKPNQKNKLSTLTKEEINTHAKNLIINCQNLAAKHNFTNIGNITIKSQKTLWGSCSHRNNINLNINLINLPPELIEYVILHELTHTKIKNHSKQFWQELSKILPNARSLDKELKGYSLSYRL